MLSGILPGNPLGRVVREARLAFLPIEWGTKYPRVHIMRWIAVGTIVAILTGNLPLSRLNPFGPEGLNGIKSQIGNTITTIAVYPLPLAIGVGRVVVRGATKVCDFLGISCNIDPGRNLDFKVRSPIVKNGEEGQADSRAMSVSVALVGAPARASP